MPKIETKVESVSETYTAEIYMAGDINTARHFLQKMASRKGMCVSMEKVDYLYSLGFEKGFVVRLINYPRFASSAEEIIGEAKKIALMLIEELGQGSCTIVCSDKTLFLSRRNADD